MMMRVHSMHLPSTIISLPSTMLRCCEYACREHPVRNGVRSGEKYRGDVGLSHLFKAYWRCPNW